MFDEQQLAKARAFRHDLHRHPELRYAEVRTSEKVAERLKALGYQVTTGLAGGTGILAELDTGRPGPVIAFRADMDALPILEANTFDHRSTHEGCMHACGHDGHTATLLLAAERIMQDQAQLNGYLKLLFQPAEEGGNGAEAMVKDGVLDNPRVDAVFGYHNRPGFEAGMLFAKAGPAMGGNDTLKVTIKGTSGHSAMPHLAVDPIYVGSGIIQQLQGLVSRHKSPLEAGTITVSAFHAGDAPNVIPGEAELLVNIRSSTAASREAMAGHVEQTVAGICSIHGAQYQLESLHAVPPVINDPEWAETVLEAGRRFGVSDHIELIDYMPTMGAEDFSFYLNEVPGCFFFVGNGTEGAYLHNEHYDFNDEILPVAAGTFVALVRHLMMSSEQAS
ncbi:amidohydrolase [Terasakiispira papahanaumokuakeensis]|uniref:Amidohydrolase n=1 Tax=Terasakiispira papahanaumokuakeensis TaxID=197479 RepID=A0A1E2V722_9GAMM|nr:M20 family metallopeptidase [Terasakiispira papahanaumokuakeensis]ODC02713.1 amidohydrolase [Terasakiispira papahanaumokuakeensis]